MASHASLHPSGLSVMQPNYVTETAEARLAAAVIITNIKPAAVRPTAEDIRLAITTQFGYSAIPLAIARFHSDYVASFGTLKEKKLVHRSGVLCGPNFSGLIISWTNRYGTTAVRWETEVAIDIDGFPPHTFHPCALGPLLERHCSIQAHSFDESSGLCRVDAYALNKESIPTTGHIGLQYSDTSGVTNVMFPVTMTAYNYNEAPEFHPQETNNNSLTSNAGRQMEDAPSSVAMPSRKRELDPVAEQKLHRARQRGHASDSSSSSSTSSAERSFYLLRAWINRLSILSSVFCSRFIRFTFSSGCRPCLMVSIRRDVLREKACVLA